MSLSLVVDAIQSNDVEEKRTRCIGSNQRNVKNISKQLENLHLWGRIDCLFCLTQIPSLLLYSPFCPLNPFHLHFLESKSVFSLGQN